MSNRTGIDKERLLNWICFDYWRHFIFDINCELKRTNQHHFQRNSQFIPNVTQTNMEQCSILRQVHFVWVRFSNKLVQQSPNQLQIVFEVTYEVELWHDHERTMNWPNSTHEQTMKKRRLKWHQPRPIPQLTLTDLLRQNDRSSNYIRTVHWQSSILSHADYKPETVSELWLKKRKSWFHLAANELEIDCK